MSSTPVIPSGALPLIKNASLLTMKLLALKPGDEMDVFPSNLPPSYSGIKSYINRLMRNYPIYLAILKLEAGPGWKIICVKDLVTLKAYSILPSKSKRMEEQMPDRNNNLTDAELIQLIDEIILFATRDAAQLIPRGVTAARLTTLGLTKTTFQAMPTDTQMQGAITEAVQIRQAAYDILTDKIGNVRTMAQNIFGEGSGTYKRFAFEGMISADDKELVHKAKQIQREAVDHAADLLPEGWDTTFADSFDDAIKDFDDKRDLVRVAKANRPQATLNRTLAGNALYTEVEKICNTGKDVFRATNPAKYADYIIYITSSSGGSGITVVVEGNYAISETVTAALTGVNSNPDSTVTIEIDDSPAGIFASETSAGLPTGIRYDRTEGSSITMLVEDFKVLIGWSPTKQVIRVQNIGMVAGSYKFTFEKLSPPEE